MLKLTLVQDDDNKGRISVNMLSSVLGKVSVEAKADRESLGMYIVSDTAVSDEGSQLLEDMEENLKEGPDFVKQKDLSNEWSKIKKEILKRMET